MQTEDQAKEALGVEPDGASVDPLGIGAAAAGFWRGVFAHPDEFLRVQADTARAWFEVASRAIEPDAPKPPPIITPEPGDKRFCHVAWNDNTFFDSMKQGYLLAVKAVLESIDKAPDLSEKDRRRLRFFAKQYCDALSPTNFANLNPAVLEETLKSGGENLRRGYEHAIEDMRDNQGRVALVDRSAFKVGENIATTAGEVVFRNELIELIRYTPTTDVVHEIPLLIVPPWINRYYVLDLQPENSFIKYVVDAGFSTYVISWRNPGPAQSELSMSDYLELGPLTAARAVREISGAKTVNLTAYCIGGTLVAMLLAYLAKTGEPLIGAVTFLASLIDFSDVGDIDAFLGDAGLAFIEKRMEEHGFLDGREMADTFNMLRANDLIWNVAVNRYFLGKDAPAFDLLFWNADSTRMPRAMHSYYLRNMYVENNLIKPGKLNVKDVPIDLGAIRNDIYSIATIEDHIAPWRSVYAVTNLTSGKVTFRLGHSGHIHGIINSPAKKKGSWWGAAAQTSTAYPADPNAWLASAEKHDGSWWTDWTIWLAARSGKQVKVAELPRNAKFPPLGPAPGTYVLEQ